MYNGTPKNSLNSCFINEGVSKVPETFQTRCFSLFDEKLAPLFEEHTQARRSIGAALAAAALPPDVPFLVVSMVSVLMISLIGRFTCV